MLQMLSIRICTMITMITLGIESSCDETGVALYCSSRGLLAHALHSQIDMHQAYGGVVPELASRDHIRRGIPLIRQVCNEAGLTLGDIDNIAYTQGPGLAGALLVGASIAKALALALGKPALGVHHLEGHLLSPLLSTDPPTFPFLALLVSGGHSMLLDVAALGQYTLLGESIDDAAGEAFDKTAKLIGLPYPGGPHLAKLALAGDAKAFDLPRPLMKGIHNADYDNRFNFSFAGLKTAVLTHVRRLEAEGTLEAQKANLAASFEATVAEVLVKKTMAAMTYAGRKTLVVAGGVGANLTLRRELNNACAKVGARVHYPELHLCTDNGAMIALAGSLRLQAGQQDAAQGFTVKARWGLDSI
jgi:N6-L-threonylcarbamoyladenine synthase